MSGIRSPRELNEVTPVMKSEFVAMAGEEAVAGRNFLTVADEPVVFKLPEPLKKIWWEEGAKELLSGAQGSSGF